MEKNKIAVFIKWPSKNEAKAVGCYLNYRFKMIDYETQHICGHNHLYSFSSSVEIAWF